MKKYLRVASLLILLPAFSFAQTPEIGTPAWNAWHNSTSRNNGPFYTPQNGNDTLNSIYSNTACGLNYVMISQRLEQRVIPLGIAQPAPFTVSIPQCAVIQQAYLYTEALGVAPSITANLTDPSNLSTAFNMTNIGSSVDVCWGMNGTHVWRTDVTSGITGPGTYLVSGLPVTANYQSVGAVDCEGATLIVIYTDPSASYTGTLSIDDGCHTVTGGTLNHTMTGFTACANSTFATDFMLVGDMQMTGYTLSMNGSNVPQPQWNWWNDISASTSVANGQSTCGYSLQSANDCFTLAVAGLYFQTGCSTCTPVTTTMTLATSAVADNCNGNGSASVVASGGSGNYTYLWAPGNSTSANPTNLAAGTYTVYVSDGNTCTQAVVVVPYTGMTISTSATNVACTGNGSATVSVSGGQTPYTYLWSSGGTNATETNLTAGTYSCTVTDATGCSMSVSTTIVNSSTLSGITWMQPDFCSAGTGSGSVSVSGGQGPYTYLWSPGNQTTSVINNLFPGIYSVTITDAMGCIVTLTDSVVNAALFVWAGNYGYYNCGDTIQLSAVCNDPNATYSWSPASSLSNPNISNPISNATSSMTYTLTVNSACATMTDTFQLFMSTVNPYNEQICFVSVDTTLNKNVVTWERLNSPTSGSYNIYKETSTAGVYALAGSQPVSQFSTFTDMSSNPTVNPDRYIITTVDVCGNESDTSYHHRTIFLTTTANGPGWDLNWNGYEGLPIVTYNIFRGSSPSNMALLTSVNGSTFTYTDANPPVGQNLYQIEAVHPFGGCSPSRIDPNSLDLIGAYSNIGNLNATGIAENGFNANALSITPNPNNGNFVLTMTMGNAQEISVNVLDNLGQSVYASNENVSSGNVSVDMKLSSLSTGIYFVQVKTANGIATKRLIIE